MRKTIFIILMMTLLISITACSSADAPNEISEESSTLEESSVVESINPSVEVGEEVKSYSDQEVVFFNNVYGQYAGKKNYDETFYYDYIIQWLEDIGIGYENTVETEESNAQIKVVDSNTKDAVFFLFAIDDIEDTGNAGKQILHSVSFINSEKTQEVSRNNFRAGRKAGLDGYETHIIGESPVKVDGMDEQRDFMFDN